MKNKDKIFCELSGRILPWYEVHARSMPWRRPDVDPYWTLVSEIMLQQTRVETVIPYFQRFIRELPSLKDLASAGEEQLLKLWEGLGYYSRVRNLQKAAQAAMELFSGQLPQSVEDLLRLPGIGEYTAGAIASIAFHQKAPAVDGNVLRVCARLLDYEKDIMKPPFRKEITAALLEIYPEGKCSEFTQSLMDLGAMICIPGKPRCSDCPLQEICCGFKAGRASLLPVKKEKPLRRIELKTVLILQSTNSRTALRKRTEKGVLSGMWELPSLEGHIPEKELREYLEAKKILVETMEYSKKGKHIFSHLEWHMEFWIIRCKNEISSYVWADPDDLLHTYSLPAAFRKFL